MQHLQLMASIVTKLDALTHGAMKSGNVSGAAASSNAMKHRNHSVLASVAKTTFREVNTMRSHRVWNNINADNYTNSKSFGGEFRQQIAVGSSASYSNHFADIAVREVPLNIGDWSLFILSLDGVQVKRAVFNNKTKAFKQLGDNVVATDAINLMAA